YRDPEIDDQYLTLYVRQSKYEETIMDKIEEIRLPYSDELADKTGYLLLTTDFQFPKKAIDNAQKIFDRLNYSQPKK
ncbi:MAG: hypothetical protein QG641_286, partial [Candidatus Poribacteria bacterium]|nr:hypothetical protein [Candidatus Poribacteria bacterium]